MMETVVLAVAPLPTPSGFTAVTFMPLMNLRLDVFFLSHINKYLLSCLCFLPKFDMFLFFFFTCEVVRAFFFPSSYVWVCKVT